VAIKRKAPPLSSRLTGWSATVAFSLIVLVAATAIASATYVLAIHTEHLLTAVADGPARTVLGKAHRAGLAVVMVDGQHHLTIPYGAPPRPPFEARPNPADVVAFTALTLAGAGPRRVPGPQGSLFVILPPRDVIAQWWYAVASISAVSLVTALLVWIMLQHSIAQREAAEKELRRFVADAGHELRTPLTVVATALEIVARLPQDGAVAQAVASAKQEVLRMRDLIEKLILLARLDGSEQRVPRIIDIGVVASRAVMRFEALGEAQRIRLDVEETDLFALVEPSDLEEALHNLIDNALKYAPASRVNVRIHGSRSEGVIEVADRGPGIARDEQARVFDRFYRGRTSTGVSGSGLGLAIVQRAVERSNGALSLRSDDNGTTVTMRYRRNANIAFSPVTVPP
jgi:signal transduction histidine kinase